MFAHLNLSIKSLKIINFTSPETGLSVQEALDTLDIVHPSAKPNVQSCSAHDVLMEEISRPPITTSCHALDALLKGGIPARKVVEICGCPGAGKTQLWYGFFSFQIVIYCQILVFPPKFSKLGGINYVRRF